MSCPKGFGQAGIRAGIDLREGTAGVINNAIILDAFALHQGAKAAVKDQGFFFAFL
jgi:hypothetical protein